MKKILLYVFILLSLISLSSAAVNNAGSYLTLNDDDLVVATYTDISENSNVGDVIGGTTGVVGKLEEGFENSGVQQGIDMSSGTGVTGTTWSVSLWIYMDSCNSANRYFLDIDTPSRLAFGCNAADNKLLIYDGVYGYGEVIPSSTWIHYVISADGTAGATARRVWKNGHNLFNFTASALTLDGSEVCLTGLHDCAATSNNWDGKIDEVAFYNHVLTADDVGDLYNSGSGFVPYSVVLGNPSINISAYDLFDNSSILNFTVTLNNGTSFDTVAGFINLNVTIGNYTLNVTYNNYFNVSNNIDVEAASNATTYTTKVYPYQTVITFDSFELISDTLLTNSSYFVNSSSGSTFYLKEGENYQVLTENPGYFNKSRFFNVSALDNITINVTGVYSSVLNISAINTYTSNPILNFSGWVYHPGSGDNRSFSSTTGNYSLNMIPGNFSVFLESEGYSLSSDNYQNITITSAAHNISFSLYSNNSILIYIKDENTGLAITSNITITLTGINETQYYTSSGSYFIEDLTDGNYSVKFSGDNYTVRNYAVTVAERSTQILTAYLIANSEEVIMSYIDEDSGATLEGVSASMSRLIGGVWTVVQSKESDITGRIQFVYLPDVKYKFTATYTDYDTKIFYLDPVIFDSYNVKMSKETTITNAPEYQGVAVTISPSVYYNDQLNNFSIVFNSPDGLFSSYSYNITFPGGTYAGSGSNAYGGSFDHTLNITGATWLDKVNITYSFDTTISTEKTYYRSYEIRDPSVDSGVFTDNENEDYGLGLFERILITLVVTIIVTGVLSLVGGILVGAPIGLLLMGYLTLIGFMPLWAALPSFLVGFILIVSRSS